MLTALNARNTSTRPDTLCFALLEMKWKAHTHIHNKLIQVILNTHFQRSYNISVVTTHRLNYLIKYVRCLHTQPDFKRKPTLAANSPNLLSNKNLDIVEVGIYT